jgi:hypothetical protein
VDFVVNNLDLDFAVLEVERGAKDVIPVGHCFRIHGSRERGRAGI